MSGFDDLAGVGRMLWERRPACWRCGLLMIPDSRSSLTADADSRFTDSRSVSVYTVTVHWCCPVHQGGGVPTPELPFTPQ